MQLNTSVSRRRLLGAIALGGAAAALAACGQSASPTAAPSSAADKPAAGASAGAPAAPSAAKPAAAPGTPATISFSTQGNPQELAMFEDIVKQFEAKNGKIKVDRKFDPSLTWEKVHVMLGAGTASSVQRTNDDDIFLLMAQKVITSLDNYVQRDMKRDDYFPSTWESRVGAGGEIGAITNGSSPMVIFYNVDHFKEAGLTAATDWKNPWTFEQFDQALDKLVKKDGSGKVTRYAYSEETWFVQPLMVNNGAQPYNEDETECTLMKTPAAEEILTWHQSLFTTRQVAMPYSENATQLFNSGLISMNIRQTSFALAIKKDLNYDVMPIFKGKQNNLTENSERCFTIPASEKLKDEAWQFGHYLWGEDVQKVFLKTDFAVPMLKKVAESAEAKDASRPPANKKIYPEGVAADVYTNNNPVGDDYQKWFSRTVNELTTGQKDPKAFLKERVDRLNEGLKNTGWSKKTGWVKGWTPGANVPLLVKPGQPEPAKDAAPAKPKA
jgi:multiple sugar transport system substrate-binding protein